MPSFLFKDVIFMCAVTSLQAFLGIWTIQVKYCLSSSSTCGSLCPAQPYAYHVVVKIHRSNLSLQQIKQQIHMPRDQILCARGMLSCRVSTDHLCVTWICSDLQGIFSKFLLSPAAKGWFVFHKLCSCFCCLCEVS